MVTEQLTLIPERQPKSLTKDYWEPSGMMYYLDGMAWGISPRGESVCLGKEVDIVECLSSGGIPRHYPIIAREILQKIIDWRKENGDTAEHTAAGKFQTVRTSNFRNRPTQVTKHQPKNTKRPSAFKKLSYGYLKS